MASLAETSGNASHNQLFNINMNKLTVKKQMACAKRSLSFHKAEVKRLDKKLEALKNPALHVKRGDTIQLYHYLLRKMMSVKVMAAPKFDYDYMEYLAKIKFENGDVAYAFPPRGRRKKWELESAS